MIRDIGPYVYKNEYKPQKPAKNSYVMCFEKGKLMAKLSNGLLEFPTFEELEKENPEIYEKATYLFAIDDMRFYLVEHIYTEHANSHERISPHGQSAPCEGGVDCRGKYERLSKDAFRHIKPEHFAFAGITAHQLYNWYQSHKFCGKCGGKMKKDEKERMLYCEACHAMEYPKICPAVIVGLHDGNRLLLTKYAGREYTKYALIAGFAEIGESIEDTVRREVMEEVGLQVKNITYYKSQPWSFTDTLLFGFYCELDGAPEITLDETELSVAEWFERKDIPVHEKSVSLTNEMILNFKNGRME